MPDEVEVRTRFSGEWVAGYEVVETDDGDETVTVRRRSDGKVLPSRFDRDEVRPTPSPEVPRGR